MSQQTTVTTTRDNDLFHCHPGRRAKVIRGYWRNGEGWYSLQDAETGERFESPDIFWTEEV